MVMENFKFGKWTHDMTYSFDFPQLTLLKSNYLSYMKKKTWRMAEIGIEKWPLCMAEAKKFVTELKLVNS